MTRILSSICIAILLFSCAPKTTSEELAKDPRIRAQQINDEAVDLVEESIVFNGEEAIQKLETSIKLDSTYDKPRLNLVGIHLQRKSFTQAMRVMHELEPLKSEVPEYHMTKGLLYDKMNDQLNAEEEFKYAVRLWDQHLINLDTAGPVYKNMQAMRLTALLLLNQKDKVLNEYPGADTSFSSDKRVLLAEYWKSIPIDPRAIQNVDSLSQ